MNTYITTIPRSSLQPLAYQGLLACQYHTQLTERLRAHLGEQYAAIFAEPMFDDIQEHIDWYAAQAGTIQSFQQLSEQEQSLIREKLVEMGNAIHTLAKQLQAMPEHTNQIAGHITELALTIPDENSIYLIDDQTVLINWGFTSSSAQITPQEITRLAPSHKSDPVITSKTTPATTTQDQQGSTISAWWLLPLLFAVILALLFFFKDPIAAFFSTSESIDLADATKKRDGLKADLIERAKLCKEEPLVIPEDNKLDDMAFLEGLWRCTTSLVNTRTGEAVAVEYLFDKQGQGSITIDSEKGLCIAKAKAYMKDGATLAITTDELITCPEGTPYSGQAIECVREASGVRCRGQNQASASQWDAQFYRISVLTP